MFYFTDKIFSFENAQHFSSSELKFIGVGEGGKGSESRLSLWKYEFILKKQIALTMCRVPFPHHAITTCSHHTLEVKASVAKDAMFEEMHILVFRNGISDSKMGMSGWDHGELLIFRNIGLMQYRGRSHFPYKYGMQHCFHALFWMQ